LTANGVLTGALRDPFQFLEESDPVRLGVLQAVIEKAVKLEKDRIDRIASRIARALAGKKK
jgi:hypothetical protein